MNLGIAGGKGGTGKTTVALSLAYSVDKKIELFDLDVEEPNLNIFLNTDTKKIQEVNKKIPVIDSNKCLHCSKCSEKCQFNALVIFNNQEMIHEELCHGCGLCKRVCPNDAITEKKQRIGSIKKAIKENIIFYQGTLDTGKAISTPIIEELKEKSQENKLSIYDCPPGTDCPVIESLRDLDYCILVTEPTPFGLNDLKRSIKVLKKLKVPSGVIINRYEPNYHEIEDYCQKNNITIHLKIPNKKEIAENYSEAEIFVENKPEWKEKFQNLIKDIENE